VTPSGKGPGGDASPGRPDPARLDAAVPPRPFAVAAGGEVLPW